MNFALAISLWEDAFNLEFWRNNGLVRKVELKFIIKCSQEGDHDTKYISNPIFELCDFYAFQLCK